MNTIKDHLNKIQEITNSLNKQLYRMSLLSPRMFIYEQDTQDIGNSYFKHEVVSLDKENLIVHTLDHSQNMKPSTLNALEFLLENEL